MKTELEEAAERCAEQCNSYQCHLAEWGFLEGAKWQEEQEKLSEWNIRGEEIHKAELKSIESFGKGYDEGYAYAEKVCYSEENNMRKAFCAGFASNVTSSINDAFYKWFEQFSK